MGKSGAVFSSWTYGGGSVVSTFVSVGNATQPFRRLLDEVARLAAALPQPVLVQHGFTPFDSNICQAVRFVDMSEFERLVAEADLLILHAGAGSVIHAVRAGKVPVVMPRRARHGEHVDDHQLEFAQALATAGRLVLTEEPEQLREVVYQALARQKEAGQAHASSLMLNMIDDTLVAYARQFSE
jgi:UDP-N-acetylglucosamine transferase subunit ALG13